LFVSRSACAPHLHPFPTRRPSDLTARWTSCAVAPSRIVSRAAAKYSSYASSIRLESADGSPGQMAREISTQCPPGPASRRRTRRSEEHTSELQSRVDIVCRLLLEN